MPLEPHSELCQTSKMELFARIVKGCILTTIFGSLMANMELLSYWNQVLVVWWEGQYTILEVQF